MFSSSVLHCDPIHIYILPQTQSEVRTFSANVLLNSKTSASLFTLTSLQFSLASLRFLLIVFNSTCQSNLKLSCSQNLLLSKERGSTCQPLLPDT